MVIMSLLSGKILESLEALEHGQLRSRAGKF